MAVVSYVTNDQAEEKIRPIFEGIEWGTKRSTVDLGSRVAYGPALSRVDDGVAV